MHEKLLRASLFLQCSLASKGGGVGGRAVARLNTSSPGGSLQRQQVFSAACYANDSFSCEHIDGV